MLWKHLIWLISFAGDLGPLHRFTGTAEGRERLRPAPRNTARWDRQVGGCDNMEGSMPAPGRRLHVVGTRIAGGKESNSNKNRSCREYQTILGTFDYNYSFCVRRGVNIGRQRCVVQYSCLPLFARPIRTRAFEGVLQ